MSPNFQKLLFETTDEQIYTSMTRYDVTRPMVEDMYQQIRDWYKAQPHLPKDALEDRLMARYLHAVKYSVERTKEKLDCYYTCRGIFPEIFNNRDPFDANIIDCVKSMEFILPPKLTKTNHRVLISRFTDYDPNHFDPITMLRFVTMMADIKISYDVCYGEEFIFDLTNIKFLHITKINPIVIKKGIFLIQKCYPASIRGIHLLNCPNLAKTTVNLIKSLLLKKLADRILFHDNLEELHKHIDPEYLPKEYGGDVYTCKEILDNGLRVMQSEEWKSWFLKAESDKSDESKRLEKSDYIVGDLLGIAGSFRKLDVD